MTGIYVRLRRGDAWVAVEIEDLTAAELAQLERDKPLEGWRWTAQLARWVREKVRAVPEEVA